MRAALSGVSASPIRPPGAMERNTGPELISAAASYTCTASTGRGLVSPGDGDLLALSLLVAFGAPDQDTKAVSRLGQIRDFEGAQLTAPHRGGKPEAEQRPIPFADQRIGAELQHGTQHLRRGRRLALLGRPNGAANPPQDGPDAFAGGGWIQASLLCRWPIAAALRPIVEALRP
jgi:hypothetical protein